MNLSCTCRQICQSYGAYDTLYYLKGYFFGVSNTFSPSFLLVEILEVLDEPIGAAGRHYKKSVVTTTLEKNKE